jgi:hypothetical protein
VMITLHALLLPYADLHIITEVLSDHV